MTSLTTKGRFVGSFAHQLQALFRHTLERIREVRGLNAPARMILARFGNGFGNGKGLLPRFDRARAGATTTSGPPFSRLGEIDHRSLGLKARLASLKVVMRTTSRTPCSSSKSRWSKSRCTRRRPDPYGCAGGTRDLKAAGDDAVNDVRICPSVAPSCITMTMFVITPEYLGPD